MADFSFSFDSDNPFAEPEPAPKSAPGQAAPNANEQNGANGEAAEKGAVPAFALGDDDLTGATDGAPSATDLSTDAADQPANASDDPFDFDFTLPEQESTHVAPTEVTLEELTTVGAPAPASLPADQAAPDISIADELGANELGADPFGAFGTDALTFEPAAEFGAATEAPQAPAEMPAEAPAEASDFDFPVGDDESSLPTEATPLAAIAIAATATDENEEDADDALRRAAPTPSPSVAILGASGIGKNHARWFHRNGARVVAFLGTSDDSTATTEAALGAEFAFEGRAYTDLAQLLESEKPDIVCVATPPALHFGHVLQSLEAGAHVLCEKPLVYAPTRKFRENRDGAKELVKVAAKKSLVLGTQLQYGAATPILCKLAGLAPTEVGDFAMEIETMNPGSSRDPRELWIDLGPHPVSVAQVLAGEGATLAEETIRFDPHQEEGKTEVLARFGINCADGRLLMVRAIVRALDAGTTKRKPRRRFSFNGHSIIYAPLAGPRGSFQAQFVAPDGYSSVYSDPVDYLIGNFLRACRGAEPLLISGDFGRENLEWMLKIGTPAEAR